MSVTLFEMSTFFLFFPVEIPEHRETVAELGPGGPDIQTLLGAVEEAVSGDGRAGLYA